VPGKSDQERYRQQYESDGLVEESEDASDTKESIDEKQLYGAYDWAQYLPDEFDREPKAVPKCRITRVIDEVFRRTRHPRVR